MWTAKQISPSAGETSSETSNKLTCVDKASDKATHTTPSGAVFQILCGLDCSGPDLSASETTTFEGCIDACGATSGCADVSYVGQACYMKGNVESAVERD